MANVRLLPVGSDLADTLRMGSEHFRRRYGATVAAETAPILRGVVEQTLGIPPGVSHGVDRWGGYLTVDETSDLVVGFCAFKGPPTADGTVEIAHYTFDLYEGQGYAKSMARALISVADSSPLAGRVIAHTLPERNPSPSSCEARGCVLSAKLWIPTMVRCGCASSHPGTKACRTIQEDSHSKCLLPSSTK